MAPLTDRDRLKAYKDALANWNCEGFVQFDLTETAYRWMKRELGNITQKGIAQLMYEYVNSGGEIDEVRETRPEWEDDHEFHHDLRFTIQGKPVYIETRLDYRLPVKDEDSTIIVVNIHAP